MGAKDVIWVCWQEPYADCGKTSLIPYSWVTEVMIGDGRAPGSVLKCRWPKTRKLYTAKVIAAPSGPHEQSKMDILRLPTSSLSADDDSETLGDERNGLDMEGDDFATTLGPGPGYHKRAVPKEASASTKSLGFQNLNDADDAEIDESKQSEIGRRFQVSSSVASTSPSNSPVQRFASSSPPPFPKELQKWFIQQLNNMKNELLNNFDQVNHKLSAMDLSIRSVRDRVNRMEGKIDLALLNLSPNGQMGDQGNQQLWRDGESSGCSVVSILKNKVDESDDNRPPSLKRQRLAGLDEFSSTTDDQRRGAKSDEHQAKKKEKADSWHDQCGDNAILAISVTPSSPTVPRRNARKSIVHRARASPISPPPPLIKEPTVTVGIGSRPLYLQPAPTIKSSPFVPKLQPIAPASTPSRSNSSTSSGRTQKKRRPAAPMIVQYKPDSNTEIIYLGGDSNYEISRQLYAETLENVYEESPVYLILSLLRRLLSDQDVARLWFKSDLPNQPNTYVLLPAFAEALKRQGVMQYPQRPLTERDYITKLNQATYDAKHRVKHHKGSTSRPESYFPLETIAIPVTLSLNGKEDPKSQPAAAAANAETEGDSNNEPPILFRDADNVIDEDLELLEEEELGDEGSEKASSNNIVFEAKEDMLDESSNNVPFEAERGIVDESTGNGNREEQQDEAAASNNISNAISMLAEFGLEAHD